MSFGKRLKELDADIDFKKKQKEYKKLKWEHTKKQLIFELGELSMVLLALFTSVIFSMIVYAFLFFEIIYPLTQNELYLLFSEPSVICGCLAIIALTPILIFGMIIAIIGFSLNFYYNKKELEQELKELKENE